MKKILLSVITIALVATVAIGATQALFSDTEESVGNTFTAGTLDLKVDETDDPVHITLNNLKPGDSEYYSWVLRNDGSVPGQPTISISTVDNYENDCTEPESDIDTTCNNPGLGDGELGGKIYTRLQWSNDGGTTWNQLRCNGNWGDHLLNTCSGKTVGLGDYSSVGPAIDTALPVLDAGESVEFRLHPWWHLTATDNVAQSDSSEFDILFILEQI